MEKTSRRKAGVETLPSQKRCKREPPYGLQRLTKNPLFSEKHERFLAWIVTPAFYAAICFNKISLASFTFEAM